MKYIEFDETRPMDLALLGRVTIDFNPVDYFHPLTESTTFKKYVGGSPANIAVGVTRHGKKAGFIGRVSDDQFGDYVTEYFRKEGIDVSRIRRCIHGEKTGLTFTEILSKTESSILMYRNQIADLQLCVDDVDEEYIKNTRALLISGTSLAASPSREAALKAMMLAKKNDTKIIFDVDYRGYNWENDETTSIYYTMIAREADIILGSRKEFDLLDQIAAPGLDDKQTAARWQGYNAKIVVIKHGKEGSTAYVNDGEDFSIKPFPVEALKSFGGGDGYASGFLYGIFEGWDIMDCLEFGSAEAAMMVRSHSCTEELPDPEGVKKFIKETKEKYGEMIARA